MTWKVPCLWIHARGIQAAWVTPASSSPGGEPEGTNKWSLFGSGVGQTCSNAGSVLFSDSCLYKTKKKKEGILGRGGIGLIAAGCFYLRLLEATARSHVGMWNWMESLESELISEEILLSREDGGCCPHSSKFPVEETCPRSAGACGRAQLQSHTILERSLPFPVHHCLPELGLSACFFSSKK